MIQDGDTIPVPRSLEEIERDLSLAEWRKGATTCFIPAVIDKGAPRRVNISLDYGLLQAIDDEAKRRGMTRSAFLSSAARNEIQERNLGRQINHDRAMAMPIVPYKTSDYLTTSQAIVEYLRLVLDDPESDDKDLLVALCNVA